MKRRFNKYSIILFYITPIVATASVA